MNIRLNTTQESVVFADEQLKKCNLLEMIEEDESVYQGSNLTTNVAIYDYEPYPDLTQISSICITFIILYFAIMVLALFGNAGVCYTVLVNHKMQTVVNYYIVNLALCDFMVGAFVLPLKLLELTAPPDWSPLNDALCTFMLYLQNVFVFASILTLVATCLERYIAVVHPLESRIQQSKSRTLKIIAVVWALPCLGSLPFLYPANAEINTLSSDYGTIIRLTCYTSFSPSFRRAYYTFLFVFFYLIPLTFIAWTCLRIARCLLKATILHRHGSLRRQEINRRKVARMVMVVVFAFTVSWTPYFLVSIVTQYTEKNFFKEHNYFFTMLCINLFAFINSSINPFIYVIMSTRFRSGFQKIFRFLLCFNNTLTATDLSEEEEVPKKFACFSKYHRRMVLIACREPTQISTESLPSESGFHTTHLNIGSFKNNKLARINHASNLVHVHKNGADNGKSMPEPMASNVLNIRFKRPNVTPEYFGKRLKRSMSDTCMFQIEYLDNDRHPLLKREQRSEPNCYIKEPFLSDSPSHRQQRTEIQVPLVLNLLSLIPNSSPKDGEEVEDTKV